MPMDSGNRGQHHVTSLPSSSQIVTLIGGSGFIGRHVARSLAKRGYRVRVACRRPDLAGHVQPLGFPGQVMPVQANVRYPASIAAVCEGAHAVVNFTGLLAEGGAQSFDAVHVFGAEACAKAARAAKASVFIQMSAIGADPQSLAAYGRTKAEGEARAKAAFPGAIVIRPSIVFGPEDGFFNKFAEMSRFAPALPLIGGGETRFQPVFVGDVAEAITSLIDKGVANGTTYELGGPEALSFKQLLQFTLDTVGRKRVLLPIPWPVAKIMGTVMGFLPGAPLTRDQVELLTHDNVVSEDARREGRDLTGLGIQARGIEGIVPSYLYRFRKAGQFSAPQDMAEK
jgi:uncharacterized protein YbjT (DUF2867 family)